MFKRKSSLALLIAASLVAVAVLAACGNKNNNAASSAASGSAQSSQAAQESGSAPSSAAAESLAPYEVSIFLPAAVQKDVVLVEQKINELLVDRLPNTTVKINYFDWSAYQEKTNLMLQAGEPMDLVFAPSFLQFFENQAKGAFLPLNDDSLPVYGNLLEQYGQGIKETIHPIYLQAPIVAGKLYAIPTNKELTVGRGLAFRNDIVEKYNFDLSTVHDLKDVEPFLAVIAENEPDIYPVYANKQDSVLDWLQDYGFQSLGFGTFFDPAQNKVIPITDAAYQAVEYQNYKLLYDWFQKGYLNKNAATTQESITDVTQAGKIWFNSTVTQPGREAILRAPNKSGSGPEFFEWTIVSLQSPVVTTDTATNSQLTIARSSKDPARAMMLLNLLHTDKDLVNLIVFGIQDVHYTKIGDNKIKLNIDSGYAPGNAWQVGNQLNDYLLDNESDNKWQEYIEYNQTALQSPLLGFVASPEPVKAEVTAYNTIFNEYRDILRTGTIDPQDVFNARNEKLNNAGIQKVADEVQKQLDAWKAANGK